MRSVITQFLAENQQLKDQANQQTTEITARKNTIEELLARQKQLLSTIESQEIVNQRLKDQVNRLTNYLDEHPNMIIQHQEQTDQQTTRIRQIEEQIGQLPTSE